VNDQMKVDKAERGSGKPYRVTLKVVADHVGLTPGTVSSVLNNSPAALSVPQHTKDRILEAARKLNYRPDFFARSLRVKRTFTIGVIAQISDTYGSIVISGIEQHLQKHGFFFLAASHRHDEQLLESYSNLLVERGVEGFITVDAPITKPMPLPTIAIAGHRQLNGVTNLVLDEPHGAWLALKHLVDLGHSEIAVLEGPAYSSDSGDRWRAVRDVFRDLGIRFQPELKVQLEGDCTVSEAGYAAAKKLLERRRPFTALLAFNDSSAIGAISAINEFGLHVPEDISVVGFDDIPAAAFSIPSLTTVSQPLIEMGEIAARTLLEQIKNPDRGCAEIRVEPNFVVRKSTAGLKSS
jgi:DNA-binding LacI/PurR family transcriptional regulator